MTVTNISVSMFVCFVWFKEQAKFRFSCYCSWHEQYGS